MSAPAGAAPRSRSGPTRPPTAADAAAPGGGPPSFDPDAVECGFDRPGRNRGPAAGYDRLAVRYRATARIAAIGHRLEQLA